MREGPAVGRFPGGQGWGGRHRTDPGGCTECRWRLSSSSSSSSVGPVSPTPTSPPSPPPFPFSRLLLLPFPLGPPPARLPLPLRLSALAPSCRHRLVLPRFPFPTQPAPRSPLARHRAPFSRARCIIYLLVFNFLPGGSELPPVRGGAGAGGAGRPGEVAVRARLCPAPREQRDLIFAGGRGGGGVSRRGGVAMFGMHSPGTGTRRR